jgi:hypothetical protein
MPYRIDHGVWLAKEVRRVKSVLMVHMVDGQEYTVSEILDLLKSYGLDYTNPEYIELGQELVSSGFLDAT